FTLSDYADVDFDHHVVQVRITPSLGLRLPQHPTSLDLEPGDIGQLGDGTKDTRPIFGRRLLRQGCFDLQERHGRGQHRGQQQLADASHYVVHLISSFGRVHGSHNPSRSYLAHPTSTTAGKEKISSMHLAQRLDQASAMPKSQLEPAIINTPRGGGWLATANEAWLPGDRRRCARPRVGRLSAGSFRKLALPCQRVGDDGL